MRIIKEGHEYVLDGFEQTIEGSQHLQFIHKEPVNSKYPSELKTVTDGTTNEEVLKVLIDRCQFLYSKFPSRETALAMYKMEEALMWLNKRTEDRKARGVEGKHEK